MKQNNTTSEEYLNCQGNDNFTSNLSNCTKHFTHEIFDLLPCIDEECGPEMYCIFAVCGMVYVLGVSGNIFAIVKIGRSGLYKSTTFACILVLSISDILVLVPWPFKLLLVNNIQKFLQVLNLNIPSTVALANFVFVPYLWSNINTVYFAFERFYLIKYPHLYITNHTAKKVILRSLITLFILIITYSATITLDFLLGNEQKHMLMLNIPRIFRCLSLVAVLVLLPFYHRSKLEHLREQEVSKIKQETANSMTKRIVIILIIFIISQIPLLVFSFFLHTVILKNFDRRFISYTLVIIYNLNYTINPYIYFLFPCNQGRSCGCRCIS